MSTRRIARAASLAISIGSAMIATTTVAALQEPSKTSPVAGPVTFTKDVAPILQKSCQNCHHPGSIGPMSLLTYEEARPWARSIKQKVSLRDMPPWFIDRTVGIQKFKNDESLSDREIATIVKWVDSGASQGNLADMPPARTFDDSDKWHIGKPDLLVSMPVEHTVTAEGSDWWGDFVGDTGLKEDRYIKAVETKPLPEARPVVHHAATNILNFEDGDDFNGSFLNEYAVGKNGDIFPENAGRLLKAGSKIRFNMHYHAVGEEIKDRTTVAFVLYPKGYVPKYVLNTRQVGLTQDLDIPAGDANVRHDGYTRMEKPARITAFQAHLHNRGKAQCLEAIYPNGRVQLFNCINRYQFGWHIVYVYDDDVAPLVPAGTILHVTSWHDNSANNKFNPDPKNWVGYGHRSSDDMSFSWVSWYDLSDADYKAQLDARNAKSQTQNHDQ
jgi:hypothetical protein